MKQEMSHSDAALPRGESRSRLCPLCSGELAVTSDSAIQEELDCRVCGASYAGLKGTSTYEVVLPGVVCPACRAHDVEGYALVVRPSSGRGQLQKGDFVFRCPRTKRMQDVEFGDRGMVVRLV